MHNDIQEALGQNYALPEDVDEDDLMGELDALEDELSSEPASTASVPSYLQVSSSAQTTGPGRHDLPLCH